MVEIDAKKLVTQMTMAFSSAVEAKDMYTNGHSLRVADYSVEIAKIAGFDRDFLRELYIAGLLHDIGKIGISDGILTKEGRLSDEEFAVMKKHPVVGYDILSSITEVPGIAVGARWHHERYDGSGYPDGLSGDSIPKLAQIISVADAYDAMTSNRSYRNSLPQEKVRLEIQRGPGKQFSPEYGEIMLRIIDEDTDFMRHG